MPPTSGVFHRLGNFAAEKSEVSKGMVLTRTSRHWRVLRSTTAVQIFSVTAIGESLESEPKSPWGKNFAVAVPIQVMKHIVLLRIPVNHYLEFTV
jgi:hypothetical protein